MGLSQKPSTDRRQSAGILAFQRHAWFDPGMDKQVVSDDVHKRQVREEFDVLGIDQLPSGVLARLSFEWSRRTRGSVLRLSSATAGRWSGCRPKARQASFAHGCRAKRSSDHRPASVQQRAGQALAVSARLDLPRLREIQPSRVVRGARHRLRSRRADAPADRSFRARRRWHRGVKLGLPWMYRSPRIRNVRPSRWRSVLDGPWSGSSPRELPLSSGSQDQNRIVSAATSENRITDRAQIRPNSRTNRQRCHDIHSGMGLAAEGSSFERAFAR